MIKGVIQSRKSVEKYTSRGKSNNFLKWGGGGGVRTKYGPKFVE